MQTASTQTVRYLAARKRLRAISQFSVTDSSSALYNSISLDVSGRSIILAVRSEQPDALAHVYDRAVYLGLSSILLIVKLPKMGSSNLPSRRCSRRMSDGVRSGGWAVDRSECYRTSRSIGSAELRRKGVRQLNLE
jgi:hypothetical protein